MTPEQEGARCPECGGDGYVDIPDPETGGVLGPAPCPNPECNA